LDKIKGNLTLDFAKGDELFVRLGGTENEPPLPGEVVYKDDEGITCRRWNWREAERTKLTEDTKNAIIVIEGLPPISKEIIESTTKELAGLIKKYCGGEISGQILNKENSEIEIL
jgi:DNA/RNA-binding domain of Phe-tRNA-synthetase-like protein